MRIILTSFLEDSHAARMVTLLDGLPLALASAGKYVYGYGISFKKYNDLFETEWQELTAAEDRHPLQEYGSRKLRSTWFMLYEAVRKQDEGAAWLLKLWAFLARNNISWDFLKEEKAPQETKQEESSIYQALRDTLGKESSCLGIMRLLLQHSLISQTSGSHGYAMHAIVHEWVYALTENDSDNTRKELLRLAGHTVARNVPVDEVTLSSWTTRRSLLPHADVFWRRLKQEKAVGRIEGIDVLLDASEWHNLGSLMFSMNRLEQAEEMYIFALQGKQSKLGGTTYRRLTQSTALAFYTTARGN